jgi:molybdopterin molybdotransferase
VISVAEARRKVLQPLKPTGVETVSVSDALGRVLASDLNARVTQPPVAVSAMDGYAVRARDVAETPAVLEQIGTAPAGSAYDGTVGPGQAVRIFTGGPVPAGADAIVIQEDVDTDGLGIIVNVGAPKGKFVRPAGLDFKEGEVGLTAGHLLGARDVALAASMNCPWLRVHRRPRVAILATGDELVMPGESIGPNQIVSSNNVGLCAFVEASGAEPIDLGIALDNEDSLRSLAAGAKGADMLVTIGGASVGDHDLVRSVLGNVGLNVDFWRIAMRPGKPLMFGHLGETAMLGLPGNPVSALVCSLIFLRPALRKMLGMGESTTLYEKAVLGCDITPNDRREDYLRATLSRDNLGNLVATPFEIQDSSMLSRLAHANCLIIRRPHAPAAPKGTQVPIIQMDVGVAGY